MKWRVHWEQSAVQELLDLARNDMRSARKLVLAMEAFERGDRADRKKLAGSADAWRIRAGDWRAILTIDGQEAFVDRIDNRRDAY